MFIIGIAFAIGKTYCLGCFKAFMMVQFLLVISLIKFSFVKFSSTWICSLNWQHQLCKNPRPNPDIKTLFTDHTCASSNGTRAPTPANNPLAGPIPKPVVFPPLGAHGVS